MNKIGLDFGTTNSTLSYFDPDRNVLDCYHMRGLSSTPYIPSFVRYEIDDQSVEIGWAARQSQDDSDYEVYSAFKMLLAEKDSQRLENFGYMVKKPDVCARSYLQKIIENYCKEKNVSQIQQMVITVPEIWIKEHNHASRECLKRICNELKLPVKKFISEPVAASAYFVHRFHEKHKQWFNGHVMVCDYGGGTLDISLAFVEGERIKVLECTGKGHHQVHLGNAGQAFDEACLKQVYYREKNQKLSRADHQFAILMTDFEQKKIAHQSDIEKLLAKYIKNNSLNKKKIFQVDHMPVFPSDMVNAFDDVIRPSLESALTEMKTFMNNHGVDHTKPEKFRVVMAGGFSNFYLVRRVISQFFDETEDRLLDIEDTALAIAKGAALIANDRIDIDLTCPISVGIVVKRPERDKFNRMILKEMDECVLKKGERLSEYRSPVFCDGLSVSKDPAKRVTKLIIFLGDPPNRWHFPLEKSLHELLPNIGEKNNHWQIGFSVTQDFLFYLHAIDKNGKETVSALGDLLARVSGVFIKP